MQIILRLFKAAREPRNWGTIAIVLVGAGFLVLGGTRSRSDRAINPDTCTVDHVSDGDTIAVTCPQGKQRIRLCGVDAPEKAQEFGQESKTNLEQILKSGKAKIVPIETDRYGRTVAEVWTEDGGILANERQAEAGLAWYYTQYADNCPNKMAIADAEAIAKKRKSGLWSGNPKAPWTWRKEQKGKGV